MAQSAECAYCAKRFNAKRASAVYCSDSCRVRASRDRRYTCYYCGDIASQIDHVVPHSLTSDKVRRWSGVDLVECCGECNRLLGANLFKTMGSRVSYLAHKFKKKHKLAKNKVEWSDDELMELKGSLRAYVRRQEDLYWSRWKRLNHMIIRAAQLEAVESGIDEVSKDIDRD